MLGWIYFIAFLSHVPSHLVPGLFQENWGPLGPLYPQQTGAHSIPDLHLLSMIQ